MKKPIEERYTTAADLAADLREWLASEAAAAPATPKAPTAAWIVVPVILLVAVLLALYAGGDREPPGPAAVTAATGDDLDVLVWNDSDPQRSGLSLADPGALPLRPTDEVRVRASVVRPMYLYLVWIDAAGAALPVYPWQGGEWSALPAEQAPVAELSLPETLDEGWELDEDAPTGMETLLLLARPELLPDAQARRLLEKFEGLQAQTMQDGQIGRLARRRRHIEPSAAGAKVV